jgi:HK97 family phage major capsid protein
MPYTNVPEELWGKMDDCKDKVMAKEGIDESSAIAICHASIVGGKSLDIAVSEFKLDALKVGARHSRQDTEALQQIHDGAVTLGAVCPPKAEVTEASILSLEINDDAVTIYGDAIKALGDGRVGGYLVRFTSDADPDLAGEYFAKDTDYGDATQSAVYYHHGLDPIMGKRRLGKAELKPDDVGIWAEAQLGLRDEYEKFIYDMAEKGKLGWSSGTAPHLVEKEAKGKAIQITRWPLGLDASLTPTPAEYRNSVVPLKSLSMIKPLMDGMPIDAAGGDAAAQEGGPTEAQTKSTVSLEGIAMEITEEKLQEMLTSAVKTGAEEALKALPARPTDVKVTTDEADQPLPARDFFKAVKMAAMYPGAEDPRLRPLKAQGLSEGVPADGGYLVPPQVAGGILENMYKTGEILSRVANDPVTGNSMVYNAVDETSRANGSRFGGLQAYWLAEAGSKTATKPTFRQIDLKLKKAAVLCYATDELLDDAAALESWLNRTVPLELKFVVENSFINGDGVGKPLGILNSPCLVAPLRIDANEVDATDIATMWSRRWPGVSDYVWLMNPTVFPQLVNVVVGNFPMLTQIGGLREAPFATMFGAPVIETEYNAALGTQGDILLVSLSQYQTITKGGVQAASSIHVAFTTDETAYRWVYRTDGQPTWHSALTPYAGSTLSPFVALSAATA